VRDVTAACALPSQGLDLVLLDYHLPGIAGLAALRAVKAHFEATPVCLQSAESSPQRVREVIEAGAAGFIPKSYRLDQIEAALRVVLRHRVYLPAEFLMADAATRVSDADTLPREEMARFLEVELSPRQRQVLALAVRGVPIKLISRELGIAEGTVKAHLWAIYQALGVNSRAQAMYRVHELHLFDGVPA